MKNFDKILAILKGIKLNNKKLTFVECFDFLFDNLEFKQTDPLIIPDDLLIERVNEVMDTSELDFHFVGKDDIEAVDKLVKENKELKEKIKKLEGK